mmetsp:Transcript_17331/g.29147  ORF Transcript_17331/g.29147 Transcript_17331/m.29147 type:complete len:186 (-) Transcript_17331:3-560(-)
MVELKQIICYLQTENKGLRTRVQEMSEKRVNSKQLFFENEMHDCFLRIMREREKTIHGLAQNLSKSAQTVFESHGNNEYTTSGQQARKGGYNVEFVRTAQDILENMNKQKREFESNYASKPNLNDLLSSLKLHPNQTASQSAMGNLSEIVRARAGLNNNNESFNSLQKSQRRNSQNGLYPNFTPQ